jgi:hypothetical protein
VSAQSHIWRSGWWLRSCRGDAQCPDPVTHPQQRATVSNVQKVWSGPTARIAAACRAGNQRPACAKNGRKPQGVGGMREGHENQPSQVASKALTCSSSSTFFESNSATRAISKFAKAAR